jgi:hypothetical protein
LHQAPATIAGTIEMEVCRDLLLLLEALLSNGDLNRARIALAFLSQSGVSCACLLWLIVFVSCLKTDIFLAEAGPSNQEHKNKSSFILG